MIDPVTQEHGPVVSGRLRLVFTIIAMVIFGSAVVASTILLPPDKLLALQGLAVVAATYAGKFIVLAPVLETGVPFSPFVLATMIALMDLLIGLLVAAHLDLLYRVPWVGAKLRALEVRGRTTLSEHPWLRRMALFAVVIVVMFPVSGTGAIGGTLFGRLIGLKPVTIVFGIALGTIVGSFTLAVFARTLSLVLAPVQEEPWFRAIGWVIVLLFVLPIAWQWLRSKQAPREQGYDQSSTRRSSPTGSTEP